MVEPFDPILVVERAMRGFTPPWFVAGGWAMDLFLGRVTREHADIEIGIYRCDQFTLRQYLDVWNFERSTQSAEGPCWVPWEPDERVELPAHQLRATSQHESHFTFEIFLNERDDKQWNSRRHPGLSRDANSVTTNSFLGVPCLSPEIQLLYKAKETRPKDQADFENVLPRLGHWQIEWLRQSLRMHHPGHSWLKVLELRPC